MFIDDSKLEKLLTKAYEEGWYGSKDLASEAASKIILDYKNEQKDNPKPPEKKRAVKKKCKVSRENEAAFIRNEQRYARDIGRSLDHPMTFTTAGGERMSINGDAPNRNARRYSSTAQMRWTVGGSSIQESMENRRVQRANAAAASGYHENSIHAHQEALEAAMMASMDMMNTSASPAAEVPPMPTPPSPMPYTNQPPTPPDPYPAADHHDEGLYQEMMASSIPQASQEAIDDLNMWVGGVDPGEQVPNDGPEETIE